MYLKSWGALAPLAPPAPPAPPVYKKFYDSSLINNFRYAIKAFLQPHASEEEREAKEIEALDKQLEDCKKKLASWLPNPRPQNTKTAQVTILL